MAGVGCCEGRRKVIEERDSATRSLYEVVRKFLMMEIEVFKPVATMLVAERHGGERGGVLLAAKTGCWRLVFWPISDPNLSTSGA
jgi:hypothetical protein